MCHFCQLVCCWLLFSTIWNLFSVFKSFCWSDLKQPTQNWEGPLTSYGFEVMGSKWPKRQYHTLIASINNFWIDRQNAIFNLGLDRYVPNSPSKQAPIYSTVKMVWVALPCLRYQWLSRDTNHLLRAQTISPSHTRSLCCRFLALSVIDLRQHIEIIIVDTTFTLLMALLTKLIYFFPFRYSWPNS